MFRRFLDAVLGREGRGSAQAIIAASRWKKYGKDRLYVHRIEPSGRRAEIGWIDLTNGSPHGSSPEEAATLRYCASRFGAVMGK